VSFASEENDVVVGDTWEKEYIIFDLRAICLCCLFDRWIEREIDSDG
jgi:hypothetical protein